jgi:DNA-binding response OmpR family regulator
MESVEKPLTGRRLLLVEDDPVVAMELDEIIRVLGAEVVGPFGRIGPALAAIRRDAISGGVLDVRLDGETTFSIIDILLDRADPILLVTGGDAAELPQQYRHVPRLQKPFDYAEFEYVARSIFRRSR